MATKRIKDAASTSGYTPQCWLLGQVNGTEEIDLVMKEVAFSIDSRHRDTITGDGERNVITAGATTFIVVAGPMPSSSSLKNGNREVAGGSTARVWPNRGQQSCRGRRCVVPSQLPP